MLDVLLLLIYNQLSDQLGPKAVFYINNVIWFLGLDLYHLYFTLALWRCDVPSIKEVPRRIVFYPLKPPNLEPRRPKLEHKGIYKVSDAGDQNPNMIEALVEEIYSCNEPWEFQNPSHQGKPGWKGKGGGKGGKPKGRPAGQNESTTKADSQQDSFAGTNFTNDMLRGGDVTEQKETTTRTDTEQQDSFAGTDFTREPENFAGTNFTSEPENFAGTNFTYIFKRPLASTLPPVSD